MQFWAMVVDSLRESRDRKIFWVLLLITGVIVLTMASIAFEGDRISLLFGMWETDAGDYNVATAAGRSRVLGAVVYLLLMLVLGWIGVILMVIATAGFFPAMMQRGTIDLLLSKPISRSRLFLYKYLSSFVFVLVQALAFVGLTFLVMGVRWGLWAPGYLLSIPLIVLLFSYVYCVTALVAVKTRSAVSAILLSLAAWFAFSMPNAALGLFETFPELKQREQLYRAMRVVAWIPPKTGDIPYLAARWSRAGASVDILPEQMMRGAGQLDADELERARALELRELRKNPWLSIGSSLLFEAAVVLWGMWIFARQDY